MNLRLQRLRDVFLPITTMSAATTCLVASMSDRLNPWTLPVLAICLFIVSLVEFERTDEDPP